MEYRDEENIKKLSKMYNYFGSKVALKVLASMSEEEKRIALSNQRVQQTIFNIDDVDVLRTIFSKSPAFFQEIMFSKERIQDLLIIPRKTLKRNDILNFKQYYYKFKDEDIKKLENFLHSIKSPKIFEQLIELDIFQIIIILCDENQVSKSFFKSIDEVKLFNNIISNDELYKKIKRNRKRNFLRLFNNISDHILLSPDYDKVMVNSIDFIKEKRRMTEDLEKVYIDEKTLSLFSVLMLEELLKFKNIDDDFVKSSLLNNFKNILITNNYDFKKIFSHLDHEYVTLVEIDKLFFDYILSECRQSEGIKNRFINFIYDKICCTDELDDNEIFIVKNELYRRMSLNCMINDDYNKLFYMPDSLKTVFYLKFGKTAIRMDYLNGISVKQLMYLNVKHVNQIVKLLDLKNEDEMSNIYSYAIKMYFVFGLERTLKILNGDYGELNKTFYDNVSGLNVKDVVLEKEGNKYIPKIFDEFINFMFANPKNNHFIDMLKDPSCELSKCWKYLYNDFFQLKERCHSVMTLKKLNIIFKNLLPTRDISDVSPDNYKLKENDILNDVCLGNKTKISNEEIYQTLLGVYDKMKKRTESSIPYINGEALNGYSYEMMKLNDPIAFTLGYKGDCCIRLKDVAHEHLLHATLCRNGRILIIYDEEHKFAGFAPLKRNGEVLIANSIECLHKEVNVKAIEAFSDAIKEIVAVSQKNYEDKDSINLVCIGTEAYAKPDGEPFPNDIDVPTIYEKDDPVYRTTDCYHKKLTIVYKNPKLDLKKIKYGDPHCSYVDPRNPISSCDFHLAHVDEMKKAVKVINAIRYANSDLEELENFRECGLFGISYCIYNDDWYVLLSDGVIYGDYLNNDSRAEKEYNIALEEFRKQKNISCTDVKLVKKFR